MDLDPHRTNKPLHYEATFTSVNNHHKHLATFDAHGNGTTDIVDNHAHTIVNGEVMPSNNHTHADLDFPLSGVQNRII